MADRTGRITFLNQSAAQLHGLAALDVGVEAYSSTYNLFTEQGEPYPPDELPLARALRGESVHDARWCIRGPGRGEILAVGNAQPLVDEAGNQTGAILTFRDDTARVSAETALRESEARLRTLTDNLPSGMVYQISMQRDGSARRFTFVSQSHERLTGVPAEEAVADPSVPYELILPEYRDALALAEEACIRELSPFDAEVPFRRRDTQEVRWSRIVSAPREMPDGSLVWDGIQIDITDRKRAEEALTTSRDQLAGESHALEVLNETGARVASELDLDRLVQTVVDAGVELTGAQFGAFFYNVLNEAGASYMLYALSGADRSAFEGFGMPRATSVFAPTFRGEGTIRSGDILADQRYGKNAPHAGMPAGHLPVRSYLAVPVASRSGEVIGGLFFGHEDPHVFTERAERLMTGLAGQAAIGIDNARLYQAAQRARDDLERRVEERTRDLEQAHAALRQAQKMEAVGQLTGGIAHDFNNLLAGIVGSLDLMLTRMAQGRTDSIERYAKAALSSAQRAAALTHRLLAFSRRQPLDPKPINANQLITSMEDLLRRTIGPLHALEFVTAGGLWTTLCDPNQLESAILNLAINARDAMPDGGKLTIETCNAHLDDAYVARQRDVTPGQYICICVTDTGMGMSREVIERAFEPFFTTKPLGQGTGLGLSMVYGFTKQSEGHLKIYSEQGQGTTIKIYLPRHRGSVAADESREAAEPPRAEAGETILVVEDEPVIRDLIVEVLRDLGYRALEAADGPSGLKILQTRERIDLVVTDVGLPGLNGRQLADHARERRPGLKVLFITGYAENATIASGFLDPGMEMITKPFAVEALATKVKLMVERQP